MNLNPITIALDVSTSLGNSSQCTFTWSRNARVWPDTRIFYSEELSGMITRVNQSRNRIIHSGERITTMHFNNERALASIISYLQLAEVGENISREQWEHTSPRGISKYSI